MADPLGDQFPVDVTQFGVGQNLGLRPPFGRGGHTYTRIAVHVHEAQGTETVEPEVGDAIGYLRLATLGNRLFEFLDGFGAFSTGGAVFGERKIEPCRDLIDQAAPSVLGEFLESCCFHRFAFVLAGLPVLLFMRLAHK